MKRNHIICHMVTSIDGKVCGDFLYSKACDAATQIYYKINRDLKPLGFICGRITMESSFTGGFYPDLSKYEPDNSGEKYFRLSPKDLNGFYAIAFDPKGRLGWRSPFISDDDPGYDKARIIQILTEQADKRYLSYLREKNISYMIVGEEEIDIPLALSHIYSKIGEGTLLLEGGSITNGYFQEAGVIDELSLVYAPLIGCKDDKPLFDNASYEEYKLFESSTYADSGVIWMHYKKEI